MVLTVAKLKKLLPVTPEAWLEVMADELSKWGVDTPHEVASFLAQTSHESDEFRRLEENLNYSAERLMVVWPTRFRTYEVAQKYEHMPQKLANYVYASRMGNSDTISGDGWRFRGRGIIQLTGRANYKACGDGIGENLLMHPEKLLEPFAGVRAACWYWKEHNLDTVDDDKDVRTETRKINGGDTELVRRQALFNKYLELLEAA